METDIDDPSASRNVSDMDGSERDTSTDHGSQSSKRSRAEGNGSPPLRKRGRPETTGEYRKKRAVRAKRAEKKERELVDEIFDPPLNLQNIGDNKDGSEAQIRGRACWGVQAEAY